MNKRGINQVIIVVLIVSLIIILALTISNVITPLIKKAEVQLEENPLKKDLGLQQAESAGNGDANAKEECFSNWQCGEWSKCKVDYNLEDIIEDKMLEGTRQRVCEDLLKCAYNKLEKEKCDTKVPVSVQKVTACSKEYVEVRDGSGVLISRIELVGEELGIQLILGDVGYCSYCYDGIQNYDENGIDCVYQGDSCPICK